MSGRIETFRAAVADRIKTILPDANVGTQFGRFDLDELERNSIRGPAVRFAVLKAPLSAQPSGDLAANLDCAAFVVTDGARNRDTSAWEMAEAIASQLHTGQLWGLVKLSAPTKPTIEPVVSGKLKDRGVSIIAVLWSQELRQIGQNVFDEAGVVLAELYVNGEEIDLSAEDHHAAE